MVKFESMSVMIDFFLMWRSPWAMVVMGVTAEREATSASMSSFSLSSSIFNRCG